MAARTASGRSKNHRVRKRRTSITITEAATARAATWLRCRHWRRCRMFLLQPACRERWRRQHWPRPRHGIPDWDQCRSRSCWRRYAPRPTTRHTTPGHAYRSRGGLQPVSSRSTWEIQGEANRTESCRRCLRRGCATEFAERQQCPQSARAKRPEHGANIDHQEKQRRQCDGPGSQRPEVSVSNLRQGVPKLACRMGPRSSRRPATSAAV